jgi:hypothetical protein
VVALQVLFQVACRLSHTSRHQQVEFMVTLTIAVALITATRPHHKHMASHMLLKVRFLINNLQSQCIMVARLPLEGMEVSDHSNHNNLTSVVLNLMLARLLNQCKAWFLASH